MLLEAVKTKYTASKACSDFTEGQCFEFVFNLEYSKLSPFDLFDSSLFIWIHCSREQAQECVYILYDIDIVP